LAKEIQVVVERDGQQFMKHAYKPKIQLVQEEEEEDYDDYYRTSVI
jgi:hypothetical protein